MSLTRRDLMTGALGGALGAAGMYELVDRLAAAQPPPRRAPLVRGAQEQHIFDAPVTAEGGLRIVVPPRHHAVATARVDAGSPRGAQRDFEERLRRVEQRPGLGVTVAWGLPYFRRHVTRQAERHLPFDHRAGGPVRALVDAVRFASDPASTVLEANDVAVLLRSDSRADLDAALEHLFTRDLAPTSIRRGFVGDGLPKRMAVAAGVPGADSIPEGAQLFLGFTSTEESTMAAGKIANLETLGHSDGGPDGYFTAGTTMHLSHLSIDLEAWYGRDSVLTRGRSIGAHSGALQSESRLREPHIGADGTVYPPGIPLAMRADFDTLDNPFAWRRDGAAGPPAAGLHFVSFMATSGDFHRLRAAMETARPRLPIRATHRQNFLVPPREHRSFPLAEI
jgi:hypothetical protein